MSEGQGPRCEKILQASWVAQARAWYAARYSWLNDLVLKVLRTPNDLGRIISWEEHVVRGDEPLLPRFLDFLMFTVQFLLLMF